MISDRRYTVKLPNGGKMVVWFCGSDSSVTVRLKLGGFDRAAKIEILVDEKNEDVAAVCAITEAVDALLHNLMLEGRHLEEGAGHDR